MNINDKRQDVCGFSVCMACVFVCVCGEYLSVARINVCVCVVILV